MKINVINGLPFISVTLVNGQKNISIENILIDTGSAGTVFDVDMMSQIELLPEPYD